MQLVTPSRTLGLMLVAVIGCLPIAPPEHIHEVEDHGRLLVTVHSHAALHLTHHHDAGAIGETSLDHGDGVTIYPDPGYLAPARTAVAPHLATPVIALLDPVVSERHSAHLDFVERLIHGPPRATASLRAPPTLT
jgi:hypothetical protein